MVNEVKFFLNGFLFTSNICYTDHSEKNESLNILDSISCHLKKLYWEPKPAV